MIENTSHLLSELANGTLLEHRHTNVELKQSWTQEVGKKISSNANKIGQNRCWIVIGVADNGTIMPNTQGWAKKVEEEISNHLNQFLDPLQACQIVESQNAGRGWIILISVGNPGAVVYWNKIAYKSASTTLLQMSPEEVFGLSIKLPGLLDYSKQTWVGTINQTTASAFLSRVAKRYSEEFYTSLQDGDPESALGRLGLLGKNVTKLLFGTGTFRIVFYDADGAPTLNETRRPLYALLQSKLYEEIEDAARKHRKGSERVFPPRAFQEAVANALAHAAYFEGDGEIMLELFQDRLCISNLCTRESKSLANRWFSRSRNVVNPLLMESLRLAGHVDELGRGKNLIFSEYINAGCEAPSVDVERAGRYERWRLTLPASGRNERHLRLLQKLKDHYSDSNKAIIALALVLWRHKPVNDIRNYVDGDSSHVFAEVLADIRGATFYSQSEDRIVLNRWARLLLHEGLESKSLNEIEDVHLFDLAYSLKRQGEQGVVTPKDIRELGELGNGSGALTLSCKILTQWAKGGKVTKVRKGIYRFTIQQPLADPVAQANLLFSVEPKSPDNQVP